MSAANGTDPGGDLVRRYLREIGAYGLLTGEEEVALARLIEDGRRAERDLEALPETCDDGVRAELVAAVAAGAAARRRFILSNLRLVVSIAKRYRADAMPLLDLVQEGNLGLMRAVEKFDHRRGFKFSTYATWWIRQAIGRAISDKGRTIRVPVHVTEQMARVGRSSTELERRLGREPSCDEVAADAGLHVDQVRDARRLDHDTLSLSAFVGRDGGALEDFVADVDAQSPFEAAAVSLQRECVLNVLAALSPRERRVLELRYGLAGDRPRTLEEVGSEFELTRERIRQIEAKAMSKLRHPATPGALRRLAASS